MSKRTLSVAPPTALPADYPRSAISETVSGKFGLAELAKVFTRHPVLSAPIVVPASRQSGGSSLLSRCYTGDWKSMPVSGIVWRSK